MLNVAVEFDKGRTSFQAQRFGAAIEHFARVIREQPHHAEAHEALGVSYAAVGKLAESIEHLRAAVTHDPGNAMREVNLGVALVRAGQVDEAVPRLQSALARTGPTAILLYNLGLAHQATRNFAAAAASYQHCLQLQPHFAEAFNNLGSTQEALGRLPEAMASFREALRQKPNYIRALTNLGNALRKSGDNAAAIEILTSVLAQLPDHVPALCNLAHAWHAQGSLERAQSYFQRALELQPRLVEAHFGMAIVEMDRGECQAALDRFGQLMQMAPDRAIEVFDGSGIALSRLGRHAEALHSYDQALARDPNYALSRWNKALLCLTLGRFAEAWPLYESRFEVESRSRPQPSWDGVSPLAGKTVLLHSEYGLGDTLHFSRFARCLSDRGARVILEVQPALQRLLRSLDPAVQVVKEKEFTGTVDYHFPLLSVPLALGTEVHSIPAAPSYLQAEPDCVEHWAEKLGPRRGLRVGIAWRGNPQAEIGALRGRSIDLAHFRALLRVPGIELISLQKNATADEFNAAGLAGQVGHFELDAGPDAFIDTAAVMVNLDLVITSDTSIAHLAGALGVRTWVALHVTADWRWMVERTDSPWYPSMRLFRQSNPGDWETVFAQMTAELLI